MDRRTTIKWVLAASATWPQLSRAVFAQAGSAPPPPAGATPGTVPGSQGFGTDPNLMQPHRPGDFWPLTLNLRRYLRCSARGPGTGRRGALLCGVPRYHRRRILFEPRRAQGCGLCRQRAPYAFPRAA